MRRISMYARPSVVAESGGASDSGSGAEGKAHLRRRRSKGLRRQSSAWKEDEEEDKKKQKLIVEEQAEEGAVRTIMINKN